MTTTAGPRRLKPAASKARTASAQQLGKMRTTSQHKPAEAPEPEPPVTQDTVLTDRVFGPGEEPAFVRVTAGGTYALAPYESLRLDVSVTLPCLPSEVDQTFQTASDLVASKLEEEEILWLGKARSV